MKNKFIPCCSVMLIFLILVRGTEVSAANKTKVWIGAGLLAGGVALGAHAASNAFCGGFDIFPPSDPDNNDCHQDEEMIAGLILIGAGTFVLVQGLLDDDNGDETKKQILSQSKPVTLGFGPRKKGWGGAIRIRW